MKDYNDDIGVGPPRKRVKPRFGLKVKYTYGHAFFGKSKEYVYTYWYRTEKAREEAIRGLGKPKWHLVKETIFEKIER